MPDRHILTIYPRSNAFTSQTCMNAVCKIQHRSTFWQLMYFTLWSEDIYLIRKETHLEIIHQTRRAGFLIFQYLTNPGQHFIQTGFTFDAFVFPVSCQTTLSNLIHSLGSDLTFHPLAILSHHSYVQRLITV